MDKYCYYICPFFGINVVAVLSVVGELINV